MKTMTEAEKFGLKLANEIAEKVFQNSNGNDQAAGEAFAACYVSLTMKLSEGFDNKLILDLCKNTLEEVKTLEIH